MKTAVVIGGAGFIGSHLVDGLLDKGYRVRVIDDLSTGSETNIEHVKDKIRFEKANICNADLVSLFRGADVIFHLAAARSVPQSLKNPAFYVHSNITGTYRVLDAARIAGAKRVVNTSSSSVYGDVTTFPQQESVLSRRLSPYAISKYAAEDFCCFFSQIHNLDTVSLRYFNVFGSRQDPQSEYAAVIPKFITYMLNGKRPPVYGDGAQSRDFTHVKNVVHANILAAQCSCKLNGEAINIANGKPISINALIHTLNELLGTQLSPDYTPERAGDIKHSYADNALAKKLIGYQEIMDFTEGLRATIEAYR